MAEIEKPDFSKVWASNSPLTKYTFTEENYLRGWDFIGSTPPSRIMFDAWMRSADERLAWLYANVFSEESLGGFMFWRQQNEAYFVGDIRRFIKGPINVYLRCTTAGRTEDKRIESLPEGKKTGGSWHPLQVNGQQADGNGNIELYNGLTTLAAFLNVLYPVGSIKVSVNATALFKDISFGTWTEVGKGRVLWGGDKAGSTIEAGLPNITGKFSVIKGAGGNGSYSNGQGAIQTESSFNASVHYGNDDSDGRNFYFSASNSNAIYGKSSTVQPPAYVVHFWQRTK